MARVCVVRQWYVPADTRVRREILALSAAGHEVDVVCLRRPGERLHIRDGRVRVLRAPFGHRRGGLVSYVVEHLAFLVLASLIVGLRHGVRPYDVVQVNTMPDTLVFAAIVPRLLGAQVLVDLHETMPEFFSTKFAIGMDHPAVRLVARAEKLAVRFAHHVITPTEQMREAFVSRGASAGKIDVIMNGADEDLFDPQRKPGRSGRGRGFQIVVHGTVEERYGIDTAVRALASLQHELPDLRLEVYGEGSQLSELRELVHRLGVTGCVTFHGFVPMDELLQGLADADAGLVAMKRDAFRDLTLCNKMFDLISMRKPVLTSRTRSVEEYFDASCFAFFEADDPDDLARAIRTVHADSGLRERLVRRASEANEPYRWPHQRARYLQIVARLAGA